MTVAARCRNAPIVAEHPPVMKRYLPGPRTIAAAVVAGMVAGCLMLLCFIVLDELAPPRRPSGLADLFTFNASVLVGPAAYGNGASVALGVALHFLVAVGWAIGYAVAAERQPQLVTRPIISGAAFGVIVYFAMQLVLVAASLYHIPSARELGVALLAHCVFYGLPVAFIVGRVADPPQRSGAR